MYYLFEQSDSLNTPIECFIFNAENEKFPVKPHWHYFAEIIYMLDGTAEMHSGEQSFLLSKGEMVIFHPQTVHSIYAENDRHLEYAVMKFDINKLNITSSYVPKLRSIFKSASKKQMPVHFTSEEASLMECEKLFLDSVDELERKNYGYDLVVKAKIYNLLVNIIRQWQEKGFSIDNNVFADDEQYSIESITEYIDRNMKGNLRITDIAKNCRLSYSCFVKKFHLLYGMSCKEYIELMRIFKVEEFLLFTDFDLNYISQETGFSDCSHMIKSFRKYRGCTPRQFRTKKKS